MVRGLYNLYISSDKQLAKGLKSILGFTPGNLEHYRKAFRHKSEFPDPRENNERLELLGDAILDAAITEHLYFKYPAKDEGFLSKLRAKLVSRRQLNDIGQQLGLLQLLKYNERSSNNFKQDIYGNTLEALVGAIYLDKGYAKAKQYVNNRLLNGMIDLDEVENTNWDFKSQLFIHAQTEDHDLEFVLDAEKWKSGRKYFITSVYLNGELLGTGEGFSKKAAEQKAAKQALTKIED